MRRPALRYDLSGAIVKGLFFEVSIPFDADQTDAQFGFVPLYEKADYEQASWILPDIEYEPIHRCNVQGQHPHIVKRHAAHSGQASWYDKTNDVIASMFGEIVFVSDRMASVILESLNANRLSGFELAQMKAIDAARNPLWLKPKASLFERALLVDRENDHCLNCGRSPLFCPECSSSECPHCGQFNVGAGFYAYGSKRPIDDDVFRRNWAPAEGVVLNARHWDGEDYLAYGRCGVITGRLAKLFFDSKARGMWIRPAQAYFPDEAKSKSTIVEQAIWQEGPNRVESPTSRRRRG